MSEEKNKENKKEKKDIDIKKKMDIGDLENKYKRALADYQNLLKQTVKEKEEFAKYANLNLIMEILPIVNNFKISVEHVPEDQKGSAWVQGIIYIKKQLMDILSANGVEEIKTVGEKFNPEMHEAVENNKNEDKKDKDKKGIIIKEITAGYRMRGKVISAAKVIVGN
ncbi:nucleotide exchange factor GrpE [Candidatus Parcubacteria bacterium]|nr:nucleotide exchange factor GrpE [Candidatus Parcubacteria bacterium]